MSNRELSQDTVILINGKVRINKKENWCPDQYKDAKGRMCAIAAAYDPLDNRSYNYLSTAARQLFSKSFGCVSYVNGTLGFNAVHQMYDRAIDLSMRK